MKSRKVIVTGASGMLGSAYIRALVPNGYEVVGIDKKAKQIKVYSRIPSGPFDILDDSDSTYVDIHGIDLRKRAKELDDVMEGADGVIVAAANVDPFQADEISNENYTIDVNTINAAVDSGVRNVIYLSSVWRFAGFWEGDEIINPKMSSPRTRYGENKQRTVDMMQRLADDNSELMFVYNDHGWCPRETTGSPPTNLTDRALQLWVAERESQQHILKQLQIQSNADFNGNFHGFIVVSRNIPHESAVCQGHRKFIFDLSDSQKLGVDLRSNVYDTLESYWNWRDIPVTMH